MPHNGLAFDLRASFYNHMIVKRHNRDTAWYSILDVEWPEICGIIENWLDDTNFDTAGRPRQSLMKMMEQRGPCRRE
jgi:hypothetical protein